MSVGRPLLDVSDVLLDPDFCDSTLQCLRNTETVSQQGRSQIVAETFGFAGVVVSDKGDQLNRDTVGEHIGGTIAVITQFRLRAKGKDNAADIVIWNGTKYTVTTVNDYTSYGAGFTEVICERVPLAM